MRTRAIAAALVLTAAAAVFDGCGLSYTERSLSTGTDATMVTAPELYETEAETAAPTVSGTVCYVADGVISVRTDSGITELDPDMVKITEPQYGAMLGAPVTMTLNGSAAVSAEIGEVEYGARAYELMSAMSAEEKAAQLFYVRYPGDGADTIEAQYQFGGYIMFAADFADGTPDTVRAEVSACQSAAKTGMFFGVDEEGGTVVRISKYPAYCKTPFLSPRELYSEGGLDAIIADCEAKMQLLTSMGFNVNMAPVVDISTDPDDFIYERSLGQDAAVTSQYAADVVGTMAKYDVASVLKHFPGYGNNADTHTGIAYDKRGEQEFETTDFLPFIAGTQAGANIVLVSHNVVECYDADRPASLSAAVNKVLREQIGFCGPVMTDDLSMDAIKDFTGAEDAAVAALLAGNDLLCSSDYQTQYPAVTAAVADGRISAARLDASVMRVLMCKLRLGIIT